MRKSYLIYKLTFIALLALSFQSCKKENGIDNETVIKKPYGLYFVDVEGSMYNTNNGNDIRSVFPSDGYPSRALITSGNNILWLKANLHVSADNGKNFNPRYFNTQLIPGNPWQRILLDVPAHNKVYIGTLDGQGIAYSENNGVKWTVDTDWDEFVMGGDITSFAQLRNGTLFAHGYDEDSLYRKDNKDDKWTFVTQNSALPANRIFYISSFNDALVATDYSGVSGAYKSTDSGKTWTTYPGLPNRVLYATAAPFDEVLLVGTDSAGVYRLQANGQFTSSNNGLEENTTVYGIIGKEDIYKNESRRKYIYLATDKGLYRSEDLGQNWTVAIPGSYIGLY